MKEEVENKSAGGGSASGGKSPDPVFVIDPHNPMAALADKIPSPPKVSDLVEGTIVAINRGRIYVDLPPFGTGLIYGREYLNAADVLRKANIGDTITAKVVDPAGREGYIELSLKEARQAAIWGEAEQAIAAQTVYTLTVEEANKGGLLMSWQGISGFLPASQLAKEHYPRVADGDKDKILGELGKLVGKMLPVRIITADPKEGKLIFSERIGNEEEEKASLIDKYQVGDTVSGVVTVSWTSASSSRLRAASRDSSTSASSIGDSSRTRARSSRLATRSRSKLSRLRRARFRSPSRRLRRTRGRARVSVTSAARRCRASSSSTTSTVPWPRLRKASRSWCTSRSSPRQQSCARISNSAKRIPSRLRSSNLRTQRITYALLRGANQA